MLTDIFSSFDPIINYSFYFNRLRFWALTLSSLLLINSSYWITPSRASFLPSPIITIIYTQSSRTAGHNLKGFNNILTPLFLLIITVNLTGLIPYRFSTSSHLIFTIRFGFPLWGALILSSLFYSFKKFTASLLPPGAPDWLNPFLVLVETIRILVRPLTLSFRLAANISAGHIVITLLGIFLSRALIILSKTILLILPVQTGYIMFEVGICLIQAYIFCLLISLYADDHVH